MRISDWSSDVCSSDLPLVCARLNSARQLRQRKDGDVELGCHMLHREAHRVRLLFAVRDRLAVGRGGPEQPEIIDDDERQRAAVRLAYGLLRRRKRDEGLHVPAAWRDKFRWETSGAIAQRES